MRMELVWLILVVVFAALEAVTISLTSLWFVIGALAALAAVYFGAAVWMQFAIFLGVSALLLLCLRPLAKKASVPKVVRTNAAGHIGKKAVVIEAIDNLQGTGVVRLAGLDWSARSVDGSRIEKDAVVYVAAIEGVKVCVERADAPVQS